MTFSIPEAVAKDFLRTVTARNRSKFVTSALAMKLKAEESALARACDLANASEDIRELEQEFDAVSAEIAEPWNDAPAR
jgi:NAD(P)-dependent dehydrogenase (short-subunit alcohol dehydrogenase family)